MDAKIKNLLKKITSLSDESSLKEVIKQLKEFKPDEPIQTSIIDFFTFINPLSSLWKVNDIPNFANNLIVFYDEREINKLINIFESIKNPLLKFLISIDSAFPNEKEKLKVSFKIILLTQKKELFISYLRKFYSTDINDLENEIFKLNLSNPFSIMFIHKTLKYIFKEKKESKGILISINHEIKNIQIFRCFKCFDLLYFTHSEKGTSLIYNSSSHNILDSTILRTLNFYDLTCCECKSIIKIYLDNYKCIKCKQFIVIIAQKSMKIIFFFLKGLIYMRLDI